MLATRVIHQARTRGYRLDLLLLHILAQASRASSSMSTTPTFRGGTPWVLGVGEHAKFLIAAGPDHHHQLAGSNHHRPPASRTAGNRPSRLAA